MALLLVLSLLSACTDGLGPVPFQGVSGTVRFEGSVPDSTDWVRLAVYSDVPETDVQLLLFEAFSDELPLGQDSVAFALALPPGRYRWLPAVWKRADVPLGLESLRVIGWYSGEPPFGAPDEFVVQANQEVGDIDLIADFDNLLGVAETLELLR